MEGFFDTSETKSTEPARRASGCGACKLHRECKTPRIQYQGQGRKGILIIGEAPSAMHDKTGNLFTGEGSDLLHKKFRALDINLEKDCWKTNAIQCKTPEGRTPTPLEVGCCKPRIWQEIETLKPKLILLMGGSAVQSFLLGRWKKDMGSINKWRGWVIPDRDAKCWVAPMFHPVYLLQQYQKTRAGSIVNKQPVIEKVFEQDLEQAIKHLDEPFPSYRDEATSVKIMEDGADLQNVFRNIIDWNLPFAFDYETTGLKPHRQGHRIVSCAISFDSQSAISFDMPEEGRTRAMFRRIMMSPEIKKIAQNMKFETQWTEERLPGVVEGWLWDTMLATHVIDNREDITGLKFQSYINFGLLPYDDHVESFLKGIDDKDSNSFNRIDQAPRKERLIYNGIDSIVTFRLAEKQMKILGMPFEKGQ